MLLGGLVSEAIFERRDLEKIRQNRPSRGLKGFKIPMLTLGREKRRLWSMIAACRIAMEEQLLRKAPYLNRIYNLPSYLIVAEISPEIGSCERVERELLEKSILHLIFLRLPCHIPFIHTSRANRSTSTAWVIPFKLPRWNRGLTCQLHNLICWNAPAATK